MCIRDRHLEELAAVDPRCDVVANRVFVADGAVYSSAGVTTGIDLLLHRISDTCLLYTSTDHAVER